MDEGVPAEELFEETAVAAELAELHRRETGEWGANRTRTGRLLKDLAMPDYGSTPSRFRNRVGPRRRRPG